MTLLAAVDPDKVTPGLLGFLVVLAIGLATWLLLRSMIRQLKKVDFDDGSDSVSTGEEQPGGYAPELPTGVAGESQPERDRP